MQELDVKIALRYYHKYLSKHNFLENQIEYLQTKLVGKVGGSVIKRPESNESNEQYKLGLIERKCKFEKEFEMYLDYINYVNQLIIWAKKNDKLAHDIILDKYIDPKSAIYLEGKYKYSYRQLSRIVDKAIEGFVNEC